MIAARILPAIAALALTPAGFALAQAVPAGAPPGGGLATQLIFMLGFLAIFYFFLIRPQQQRAKKHADMIAALKRGDTIVTSGGLIGKVNKVNDNELLVDLADNVRVRVVKGMVIEVRNAAAPVAAAND